MIRLESYKYEGSTNITESQFVDAYGQEALDALKASGGEQLFPGKNNNVVRATTVYKFGASYSAEISAKNLEEAKKLATEHFAEHGAESLEVEQTEFEE